MNLIQPQIIKYVHIFLQGGLMKRILLYYLLEMHQLQQKLEAVLTYHC